MIHACMIAYTFYETDNRVRRYAETLVKQGASVDAIVLRRKGQQAYEVIQGVHIYRIQRRTVNERHPMSYLFKLLLFFLHSSFSVCIRHLRKRYNIIHVHSVPDFEVFATFIPKLLGARIILDIHDIVPELYASKFGISNTSLVFRLLVQMERLSCIYADYVIVANHLWSERLVKRVGRPDRIMTILNYPDTSLFHPRTTARPRRPEFLIFYPGTLSSHQGVDLLVAAVAKIHEDIPNIKLLIVGDGAEQESLLRLAIDFGVEERVSIRNGIPIEQIAETMAGCDLGVEPKRKSSFANEALSTKILEFMAVGVPVLASDTIVHKRYFDDGLVEFFESENVDHLAAKILGLSLDAEKRDTLRKNGIKYIAANNWTAKKYEYLKLVSSLVKR